MEAMESDDIQSLLPLALVTEETIINVRRVRYQSQTVSDRISLDEEGLSEELQKINRAIVGPKSFAAEREFVLLSTTGDPARRTICPRPLNISRTSLASLMDACEFPAYVLRACIFKRFHMSHHTQYSDNGSQRPEALVVLLRNPQHGHSVNVALRIRLVDLSTVCFLSVLNEDTSRTIEKTFSERGRLISTHPLYFLILVMEIRSVEHNAAFEKTLYQIYEVESATEMTPPFWKMQIPSMTKKWLEDYDNLLRRLHELHTQLCHFDTVSVFYTKWAVFLFGSIDLLEELRGEVGLPPMSKRESRIIRERIQFTRTRSEYTVTKTKEMLARVKGQINVVFSLVTQKDSKVNIAVAEHSNQLATLAANDSETMKTITVLTLLFLPSNLITSIWAAGLFEIEDRSRNYQVYIVATMTLTIAVFAVWLLYLQCSSLRRKGMRPIHMAALDYLSLGGKASQIAAQKT
ncbi:hypothetical protein N0V93_006311 [Gnomoniopsis smithogilvyi]|uniref:Uncharacterized protein n=1 Tax=Gnomoniopsis smithogilvyi TaxID=1191159 RepID=A0A9W9CVH6_9PEZI|nr:hypothetical protein N0V93_006311 [Gnomoniopsis smithogilvyi]